MRRGSITPAPIILGAIGVIALWALLDDQNVRTWASVMAAVTFASAAYAAFLESRIADVLKFARSRRGSLPRDDVRRELDRARRHERPLAMVRLDVSSSSEAQAMVQRLLGDSADTRRPLLRTTDRAWRRGPMVFVIMPETTVETGRRFADRVRSMMPGLAVERSRVVAFPDSGLTIGSLFAALDGPEPGVDQLEAGTAPRVPAQTLQPASVDRRRRDGIGK